MFLLAWAWDVQLKCTQLEANIIYSSAGTEHHHGHHDPHAVDLSAAAELVEGALGHPWEDVDHRVQPVLLVSLSKGDYLQQFNN